jgi:hypothetical protein
MTRELPTKLLQEPLVDAVFEFRFKSIAPVSLILPGLFFNELDGDKSLSELPAAQIPKQVRDGDPMLQFTPTHQMHWGNFVISFSDKSLQVGCKIPSYPGWTAFKAAIKNVINIINKTGLVTEADRCSMKFIDLIEKHSIEEQVAALNLNLTIANHRLKDQVFQCRMEVTEDNFVHIIQIVAAAQISRPGEEERNGLIIDIDTVCNLAAMSLSEFIDRLDEKLDALHSVNKRMFFDCLTDDAIESLEPKYESGAKI